MLREISKWLLSIILILLISITINNCSTGVEPSPPAGILRITIQPNPADTFVVIVMDTFTIACTDTFIGYCDTTIVGSDTTYSNCDTFAYNTDFFPVIFSQAKAYNGNNYSLIFTDTEAYKQEDSWANVIQMVNGEYIKWRIYESHLPPQNYNRVQIGVNSEMLRIGTLDIPVQLPADSSLLMNFHQDFKIEENKVTEINLQISPFQSVERYRDIYHFTRKIEVLDINYH